MDICVRVVFADRQRAYFKIYVLLVVNELRRSDVNNYDLVFKLRSDPHR